MRKLLLAFWLLIPVVAWAYHRGPGQEQLKLDDVTAILQQSDAKASAQEFAAAELGYIQALELLPEDRVAEARRVRLELAKVQMENKKLPEANSSLELLVEELEADPAVDPALLSDARSALANSQYYMTWLLRLEGEPEAVWGPKIDSSRQLYRLLAEGCQQSGDSAGAKNRQEDVESAIRLARMDLHELSGLPLPSQ
jgi:cell division protein FtsB